MLKKIYRLFAWGVVLSCACVVTTSAFANEIVVPVENAENPEEFDLVKVNIMENRKAIQNEFIQLLDEHAIALKEAEREGLAASLKGGMKGQEALFYDKAMELSLDPVFVVSLASHETGAGSSYLCINNHNFGGMRGGDGWMRFSSREAGIEAFLNLLVSYNKKGMGTPERMVARYAANSPSWVGAVRGGMSRIQAKINSKVAEVNKIFSEKYEELKKEL